MTKPKNIPFTVAELHEMFDERTPGVLWWRHEKKRRDLTKPAGCTKNGGYCYTGIDGSGYQRHRLIWYIHTGTQPNKLDHIRGVEHGDSMSNLQVTDASRNEWKQKKPRNNSSGYVGVAWSRKVGMWQSMIMRHGKSYWLGYFDDPKDAHEAYLEAKKNLHEGYESL